MKYNYETRCIPLISSTHPWKKKLHKFQTTPLTYSHFFLHFFALKFRNPQIDSLITLYLCWFDTMHSPIYQTNTGVYQCSFLRINEFHPGTMNPEPIFRPPRGSAQLPREVPKYPQRALRFGCLEARFGGVG